MTNEKQTAKEAAFWKQLCKVLPWQLVGFTALVSAHYQTGKYSGLVLTRSQVLAILAYKKGGRS